MTLLPLIEVLATMGYALLISFICAWASCLLPEMLHLVRTTFIQDGGEND